MLPNDHGGADGVRRRTVNENYLRLFRTPYLKLIILSDTDPYPYALAGDGGSGPGSSYWWDGMLQNGGSRS